MAACAQTERGAARFDAVANGIVCEDVKRLVLDVVRVENLHRRVREPALWEELRALHEEKNFVALNHRLDPILSRFHEPRWRRDARARRSRRWPRERHRQQRLRGGEEEEGGEHRHGTHGEQRAAREVGPERE